MHITLTRRKGDADVCAKSSAGRQHQPSMAEKIVGLAADTNRCDPGSDPGWFWYVELYCNVMVSSKLFKNIKNSSIHGEIRYPA